MPRSSPRLTDREHQRVESLVCQLLTLLARPTPRLQDLSHLWRHLGLTLHALRPQPPKMPRRVLVHHDGHAVSRLRARRDYGVEADLIFIDETGCALGVPRRLARAARPGLAVAGDLGERPRWPLAARGRGVPMLSTVPWQRQTRRAQWRGGREVRISLVQ